MISKTYSSTLRGWVRAALSCLGAALRPEAGQSLKRLCLPLVLFVLLVPSAYASYLPVTAGGNIGIGTTTASEKLEVIGTVKATRFIGDGSGLTGLSAAGGWTRSGTNVYTTTTADNVGIGSSVPQTKLDVQGTAYFNGNVGIGTSVPREKLEISGNAYVIGNSTQGTVISVNNFNPNGASDLIAQSNNSSIVIQANGSTLAGTTMGLPDASWNIIQAGSNAGFAINETGAGPIMFGTADTERIRITVDGNIGIGSSIPQARLDVEGSAYFGNGNIGMGSSVPSQKIDVLGTVKATAFIGDGSGLSNISGSVSGLNTGYISKASSATTINDSAIYQNGSNIGIGTTSPGARLQIYPNANSTKGLIVLGDNNGAANIQEWQSYTGSTLARVTALGYYVSNTGFVDESSTYGLEAGLGLQFSKDLGVLWSSDNLYSGTKDIGLFRSSVGVLKVTNGSTGWGTLIAGNVGIGTTAPQAKLDVEGSAYFGNGNIGVGSAVPSQKVDVLGTVKATAFIGDGSGLSNISGSISGLNTGYLPKASSSTTINDSAIYQNGSNIGIGSTAPAQKLDVLGNIYVNGNIGIGSTNPTYTLDINGTLRSGNIDAAANGAYLGLNKRFSSIYADNAIWNNRGSVTISGNNFILSTSASNYPMLFQINGNSAMMIDTNFNVGIGSSVPQAKLDVEGSAYFGNGNIGVGSSAPSQKVDVLGTVKAIAFIGDGSGLTGLPSSGGWSRTGTNVYVTTSTDNVGIGSSVPQTKLDVQGTAYFNGNVGIGSTGPVAKLDLIGTGTTSATSSLVIRNSTNAAKVTVLDNGNVGIGTSAPAGPLDVNSNLVVNSDGSLSLGSASINLGAAGYSTKSIYLNTTAVGPRSSKLEINATAPGYEAYGGRIIMGAHNGFGANVHIYYGSAADNMNGDFRIYDYDGSTTPTLRMIVDSGGNLGIGSSVPLAKLDVEGNVYVGNGNIGIGSSAPQAKLNVVGGDVQVGTGTFNNPSASEDLYVTGNLEVDGAIYGTVNATLRPVADIEMGDTPYSLDGGTNGLAFDTNNDNANEVVMNAAGNIGVGVNAPAGRLVVKGAGTAGGITLQTQNSNGVPLLNALDNGNVGIGTTAPATLFEVNGSARISGSTNPTPVDGEIVYDETGHYYKYYSSDDSSWHSMGSGTITYYDGIWEQNGTIAYYVSGNVGVGEYAPESLFSVGGEVSIGGNYATITAPVDGLLVEGQTGIGTDAPGGMLGVNGSAGIGVTYSDIAPPASGLIVEGNTGIGLSNPFGRLVVKGAGTATGITLQTQNSSGTALVTALDNGNVGVGSSSPAAMLDVLGAGITSATSSLILRNSAGTANVIALDNGNVGIGTTAPVGLLNLQKNNFGSTSTDGLVLENIAAAANNAQQYSPRLHLAGQGWSTTNSASQSVDWIEEVQPVQGTTPTSKLVFSRQVNGGGYTEEMRLDFLNSSRGITVQGGCNNLGNVSVGQCNGGVTVLAAGPLSVATGGGSTPNVTISGQTGNGHVVTAVIKSGFDLSSSPGDLLDLRDSNSNNLVVFTGLGNVGIGSSAPSQKVDVLGTVKATAFIGDGSGLTGINGASQWSNGASSAIYYTSGNVGIGTSVVNSKLEVKGDIRITTSSGGQLYFADGSSMASANTGSASSLSNATDAIVTGDSDADGSGGVILKTGNNDRLHILNDGNVGIGTSVPGSLLEVGAQKFSVLSGGNVGIGTAVPSSLFEVGTQKFNVLSNGYVGIGTTVPSSLFEVGARKFNVLSGGNVGINSAAPQANLDVEGNVYFGNGNIGIGSTAPQAKLLVQGAGSGTGVAFRVQDSTAATKVTVFDNGNVGIGTTSNSYIVNVGSSSASQMMELVNNSNNNWTFNLRQELTPGVNEGPAVRFQRARNGATVIGSADGMGKILAQGYDGTAYRDAAEIHFIMDGAPGSNDMPGRIEFSTTPDGSSTLAERMRITNAGYVGIGSSAPTELLEINGRVYISPTSAPGTTSNRLYNVAGSLIWNGTQLAGATPTGWVDAGTNIYLADSTDNVGIGTSEPRAALEVQKTATEAQFAVSSSGTSVGDYFLVDQGGNVGIGSSVPTQLVDIQGASNPAVRIGSTRSDNAWSPTTDQFGAVEFYSADGTSPGIGVRSAIRSRPYSSGGGQSELTFSVSGGSLDTEAMRIHYDGNVGIGSTVPQAALDVTSSFDNLRGAIIRNPSNGTAAQAAIQIFSENVRGGLYATSSTFSALASRQNTLRVGTSSNHTMYLTTNDIDRVTIASGGNVGIGSSAPSQKVDVIGTVKATAFIGDGSGLTGLPSSGGWSRTGTNVYVTTSTDNVGIGSSVPQTKLDVQGTAYFNGNVGIGTATPSYLLHVNGAAAGVSWTNLSDERFKTNIRPLEGSLEKILMLRGVSYEWKTPTDPHMKGVKLGVIAQAVEKVYPQAVTEDNAGVKGVDYNALMAPLIEAIREQEEEIRALRQEVEQLREEVRSKKATPGPSAKGEGPSQGAPGAGDKPGKITFTLSRRE